MVISTHYLGIVNRLDKLPNPFELKDYSKFFKRFFGDSEDEIKFLLSTGVIKRFNGSKFSYNRSTIKKVTNGVFDADSIIDQQNNIQVNAEPNVSNNRFIGSIPKLIKITTCKKFYNLHVILTNQPVTTANFAQLLEYDISFRGAQSIIKRLDKTKLIERVKSNSTGFGYSITWKLSADGLMQYAQFKKELQDLDPKTDPIQKVLKTIISFEMNRQL